MSGPPDAAVGDLVADVRAGRRSARDLVEASLDRIDATDDLNSFITVIG